MVQERILSILRKNIALFIPSHTPIDVLKVVDQENIGAINLYSLIIAILETLLDILYCALNHDDLRKVAASVANVAVCAIICLVVFIISTQLQKRGSWSHRRALELLYILYIVLTFWGISASVQNYIKGNQMITFYLVQFCFVSFFTLHPLGSFLIPASYIVFYMALYHIDQAATIVPMNFIALAFITMLGSVVHFRVKINEIQRSRKVTELNERLAQAARYDALSGLKNRYALEQDIENWDAKDQKVLVLITDIDRFKTFNDTYGHRVGDRVIRVVSRAAMDAFGAENCYRFGGDEILVLSKDASEEWLHNALQNWDRGISAAHVEGLPDDITVTVSRGSAIGVIDSYKAFRTIFAEADQELYLNKAQRKN